MQMRSWHFCVFICFELIRWHLILTSLSISFLLENPVVKLNPFSISTHGVICYYIIRMSFSLFIIVLVDQPPIWVCRKTSLIIERYKKLYSIKRCILKEKGKFVIKPSSYNSQTNVLGKKWTEKQLIPFHVYFASTSATSLANFLK